MAAGLAFSSAPASAGVHVGVAIGGPVVVGHPHRGWCWHHPRRCNGGVIIAPSIGVYYDGFGYWDGHRYWRHRHRWHGHWRYY
jgi:hypothetical protein